MAHKSRKKRSSHRTVEANRVSNPQASPPGVTLPEGSGKRRLSVPPLLLWFLGLSTTLIVIGLLAQDIPQAREGIRWLIYRRGYPYPQAILFSALAVTASVAVPGGLKALAGLEKLPEILRLILTRLAGAAPGSRHPVWGILFFISLVSFLVFLYLPTCFSPEAILVSFDIFEGGRPVSHVSPGEMVAYAPSRFVEIEAKLEMNLFNLSAPPVNCEWTTHTGDGRLIQATNCKINYQTGSDERLDPVVVSITQRSCSSNSLGHHSFFLSKSE
ncbi:MAG TPA: hypothetical protein VGK56_03615 [Anaerolineales bacterium]